MENNFKEEDLKLHKQLDDLLTKSATWNLSTVEAIQLYRSMVWFAQLGKKIESNIMEIRKVGKPDMKPEQAPSESKKGKK